MVAQRRTDASGSSVEYHLARVESVWLSKNGFGEVGKSDVHLLIDSYDGFVLNCDYLFADGDYFQAVGCTSCLRYEGGFFVQKNRLDRGIRSLS